jgi:LuxR family maltose regulon positive regulatory protein
VSVLGDADEARRLLDAARSTQAGSLFSRMYTEAMEGVLDLSGGRLRQAASRFRVALASTPRSASYNPTNGNAWAGVLHAGVLYETNDLDGADHLLNVYLPLARDVGLPDHVISSYRMRARIAFLRGDVDAAFGLLTELEYLGHERQLARVTASARLEHARIFVLQGNRLAAAEALERADDPSVWPRVERLRLPPHEVEDIAIARLRWGVRFGDCHAMRVSIAALLADAQLRGRRHRSLKLQVLRSLAEAGCGDLDAAAATLSEPLRHGASEGFVRLMLDEGPSLAPVLQHVLIQEGRAPAADPQAAAHARHLLAALGEPAEAPEAAEATGGPAASPALAEPLTRKELRVLELLASGYSNAAMAEKLFVSDSTVRTHLRSINLKLGARSRTQAVALARHMRVLR